MDIAILQPPRCIFTKRAQLRLPGKGAENKEVGHKAQKTSISSNEMEVFISSGSQGIP